MRSICRIVEYRCGRVFVVESPSMSPDLPSTKPPLPPDPQEVTSDPDLSRNGRTNLFAPAVAEKALSPAVIVALAASVLIAVPAGVYVALHRHPPVEHASQVHALDPYAASLTLSGIQMSESTSLSGGKSTYIDGRIRNVGSGTVTSATAQVLFANDAAMPPQVETVPIQLIRTHEPYIDTEPLAEKPLAPGDEREFRLIFEGIGSAWNGQLPEIHVVAVSKR